MRNHYIHRVWSYAEKPPQPNTAVLTFTAGVFHLPISHPRRLDWLAALTTHSNGLAKRQRSGEALPRPILKREPFCL